MKNTFLRSATVFSLATLGLAVGPSCTKDLDRSPTYDLTADVVFKDAAGYKAQLAKSYSGFALTGSQGPNGAADLQGVDGGSSDYIRQLWSAQELTTDEGVIAWGDPGVQDWHNMNWTASGILIRGMYSRLLSEVTTCNNFLAEATDAKLTARGISSGDATQIGVYRAEVRFLRALAYYHAMDLYGNPPFATETFDIGSSTPPPRISRTDLFAFLEKELKEVSALLPLPRANEYGRADRGAAWALLAKMYLNAEVYTGTQRYADAATYAKMVIDSGTSTGTTSANKYTLLSTYKNLFVADNHINNTEVIFPIVFDGKLTQTYGGTTFLTHAAVSGTSNTTNWIPGKYGIDGGWGGVRATSRLYQQFPSADSTVDSRARFQTIGQTLDIPLLTDFKYGYVPIKFRNVTSSGAQGSDKVFVDTDYPMLRLADVYLTYAEAAARGFADRTLGVTYVNLVRTRAFNNSANGNITVGNLTPEFILAERSRELYWEATRRTDLIRYGLFTSNTYLWPWKGGVMAGQGVASTLSLFPIPASELNVNPNLVQNPGY